MNSNDLNDFPQIDVTEIRGKITFGWYQINQGLGYLAEHFDTNGNYEIRINKNVELDKDGTRLFLVVSNLVIATESIMMFTSSINRI